MQALGIDRAFWTNRRVFVTGHTGFLGGWLCLWLSALGARVRGYALPPPTEPSFFEAVALGELVDSVIADIRDKTKLNAAMDAFAPEIVIHLAAQPLVRLAHAEPAETFDSNVMGTVNLLDAVRRCADVRAVVAVTSDKVYDNVEWDWGYRENDRLGAHEPYGASKACAELVIEAYRRSYFEDAEPGVGIATVRAGNIIGGGDWAGDRLVPDAVRSFVAGAPLHIRNPVSVRPWQHVLEPGRGIAMLAQRLHEDAAGWSGAWNFGPQEDDARPVSFIAEQMARLWGEGAKWRSDAVAGAQPYEARLLSVNSTKAAAQLAWRPRWSLERALAATVEWYRGHRDKADMRDLSLTQIQAFAGAN